MKLIRDYKKDPLISEEAVKKRVREIRIAALNVRSYKCIKEWYFLLVRIQNNPYYNEIIKDASNKTYLDIGCCFGIDMRQLLIDGVNPQNICGVDIESNFIQSGFDLFEDKHILSDRFIIANFLEEKFYEQIIKKLGGPVDVIYAGSVIHLLEEKDIAKLVLTVFTLLKPGGVFLGQTAGSAHAGIQSLLMGLKFLHSKDSLTSLLRETGFVDVQVNEHADDDKFHTAGSRGPRENWRFFSFACKKPYMN